MALTGTLPSPPEPLCAQRESKENAIHEISEQDFSNPSDANLHSPTIAMEETQSTMQSNALPFTRDTYFPSPLTYSQFDGCDAFAASTDNRDYSRQSTYYRGRPSPPCSRTPSYDNMTSSNIARSDELDTTSAQNSFYSAPAMSSARDISTAYDTLGQQYPSQRDYFDRSVYPPSNTPLGTPGYAQTTSFTQDPTQSFDMSFMSQPPPTLPVPDRQPTWDSKWKSLFDSSKGSGLPSPSSTASQYQQSCRSDSAAFLAPEYDTARRHSTDTGSNSAKSVKSSYNPVSTVLAHHVYSVMKGEQAWNVLKQLQREDIVRDVWSEIATLAHPDKVPHARESRLWEQIVSGQVPLDLYRLDAEDHVLLFAGLSILAKGAAKAQSDTGLPSTELDPLKAFIDAHAE